MELSDTYLQVDPDFLEILGRMVDDGKAGKVHYFDRTGKLEDIEGSFEALSSEQDGEYLRIGTLNKVRLDRIITVLGRPGPAYPAYERYANACLNCVDEGQFL